MQYNKFKDEEVKYINNKLKEIDKYYEQLLDDDKERLYKMVDERKEDARKEYALIIKNTIKVIA